MGELTTMNQKNNRENSRRLRKRSILIRKITFYSLLILFAGVVYIFWYLMQHQKHKLQMKELLGHIMN